jgi:hypothetical protein
VASKRELPKKVVTEEKTLVNKSEESSKGEQMDLPEFVTQYRRRVQGILWNRADKITVADLVKLTELERETQKHSESKRPRELRVVWINKNKSTT